MVEDRVERGCPAQGRGRLRNFLLVLLALAGVFACAVPALAASGGAGLGTTNKAKHRKAKKPPKPAPKQTSRGRRPGSNPLTGRAMWIWELPQTDGGNLATIIAAAHQWGVRTLMIKSSDGTNFWSSQFTPQVVSTLHAAGINVCAWQYVYGNHPVTEAYMGYYAVRDGADCLLIDAETEYEGKYVAAQTYIQRLRKLIGGKFPVALAGFPYVDFHPAFPYSVFLGPGGAQYNVPQMYWKDIGTSVDAVFAHTYDFNMIYKRPIYPLGQVYSSPPARQIVRFRQLSLAYGAGGVSWWDWQEAKLSAWTALSRPAGPLHAFTADPVMADLGHGAQGDLVVWAQEHLISAGYTIGVNGNFGSKTLTDVEAFQTAHGLTADGIIGPETWAALLRYQPAKIVWGAKTHGVRAALATVPGPNGVHYAPVPESASRPARRDEIAGAGGAGRP
jgi:Putative peptidoglycan binding domain